MSFLYSYTFTQVSFYEPLYTELRTFSVVFLYEIIDESHCAPSNNTFDRLRVDRVFIWRLLYNIPVK